MIQSLAITVDEQRKMKTIIDSSEKLRRQKLALKTYRTKLIQDRKIKREPTDLTSDRHIGGTWPVLKCIISQFESSQHEFSMKYHDSIPTFCTPYN